MAESIEDLKQHVRVYITVFAGLAVLTVATVGASLLDMGTQWNITVALIIATIKASLVAGYFMHLISERQIIYWVLILCAVFFVVLIFLPVLVNSEVGIPG
ncbi:MAG: cytochrome C oxidase subunit IV family protein [Phycisphaerae bacterium]